MPAQTGRLLESRPHLIGGNADCGTGWEDPPAARSRVGVVPSAAREALRNAMISYYERYLHGEHAAVWDELSQVGEAIFTEPLYADALAVAFATMQRAQ